MRYYTEKPKNIKPHTLYFRRLDHPMYNSCNVYELSSDVGLAIVQQRFNPKLKVFWYSAPDSWIMDEIIFHPSFADYVFTHADKATLGLYPTVTVRQVMFALKMKPLKKEWWEGSFDDFDSQDLHAL